jgi:tetratricopeptide (TPR) repeat protein
MQTRNKGGGEMELQELSMLGFVEEFREVTQGTHPRRFCFILGAGASLSSGIRSGERLVAVWEEDLKKRNPKSHEDWKKANGITPENRARFYSQYYDRRFPLRTDGYAYLENEMEKASLSAGYAALAFLLCKTANNVVLTTNFDHLAEDAVNRLEKVFPLVIGHEALAHYISAEAKRPVIIKIHRDLLLDPKSREADTKILDSRWVEHLGKVFANYHPIFIGYAGNDNSLMDYLRASAEKFQSGEWKLPYWTLYGDRPIQGLPKEFMEAAGGYVIRGCDFDELMIRFGGACNYQLPSKEKMIQDTEREFQRLNDKINEVMAKKLPAPELSDKLAGSGEKPERKAADADEAQSLDQAIGRITGDTDPESRGARYRKAIQAYNRENYTKAEALLRQLVKEEPENALYHDQLGVTLNEMKRYEEAEAESRRAVELEPENAGYHDQLSTTLHEMKRYEEAEAEERRAVELEPENAFYHDQLGVTLLEMKRYEEAEAEERRAVELEPENALYHDHLGVTYNWMKRYPEAEAEARLAVELEPENAKYHFELGIDLHWMKRYEEARAEKQRAVELEPENARYHDGLGVTLREMGRYEEALRETEKAIALEPEEPDHYDRLESLYSAWGKPKEARKAKEQAEKLRKGK